jgi:hypothetical protein
MRSNASGKARDRLAPALFEGLMDVGPKPARWVANAGARASENRSNTELPYLRKRPPRKGKSFDIGRFRIL